MKASAGKLGLLYAEKGGATCSPVFFYSPIFFFFLQCCKVVDSNHPSNHLMIKISKRNIIFPTGLEKFSQSNHQDIGVAT